MGEDRGLHPCVCLCSLAIHTKPSSQPFHLATHMDAYGIPKVNFFTWLLIHRKVLTGENLAHRGIIGPHWCILCRSASENVNHLFVSCIFAQSVWVVVLHGLYAPAPLQCTVVELFSTWTSRYPRALGAQSLRNQIWHSIPKFIS